MTYPLYQLVVRCTMDDFTIGIWDNFDEAKDEFDKLSTVEAIEDTLRPIEVREGLDASPPCRVQLIHWEGPVSSSLLENFPLLD